MAFSGTGKVWINGQLVEWADAKIHIASHVIHYGSAVFEGARCYSTPKGSACFRLDAHMRRLMDSAKIYRMDPAYTQAQLEAAVLETIRANHDAGLLHPPARVPRLRGPGRQSVPLPHRRGHHALGVGHVPGRRRPRERRGRQGQLVVADGARLVPVACQDERQLRQRAAHQDGGHRRRLRRGHRPRQLRLRQRGVGPEHLHRPQRRAATRRRWRPRSSRASRATRSSRSRRNWAIASTRRCCPARCCTSPTSSSSPGRPWKSRRSGRSTGSSSGTGARGPITAAIQRAFFGIISGAAPDTHNWLTYVYEDAARPGGPSWPRPRRS